MGHGSDSSNPAFQSSGGVVMNEPEPETAEERMVKDFLVFAKYIALCLLVAGGVVGSGVLGI